MAEAAPRDLTDPQPGRQVSMLGRRSTKTKARRKGRAFCFLSMKKGNLASECAWYAWQRPTLPPWQYHRRWSVSRPSSRWDRVGALRQNHQANKAHSKSGQSFIRIQRTLINESNQANRAISTGKLHVLPRFHTQPINVVVYDGSQGKTSFEVGFLLRCLQQLSLPHLATLHCRWRDNRSTRGASIPVLSY
jgi:hypothetical protein